MSRLYGATTDEAEHLLDSEAHNRDPYSSDDDDGSPPSDAATSGRSYRSQKRKRDNGRMCGGSRAAVAWPLLLLMSASVFYSYILQNRITLLSAELASVASSVGALSANITSHSHQLSSINETLASHSVVIARFEHSVSNSDVLKKLQQLEEESDEREERVEREMKNTKDEINMVLAETKGEIDKTVG